MLCIRGHWEKGMRLDDKKSCIMGGRGDRISRSVAGLHCILHDLGVARSDVSCIFPGAWYLTAWCSSLLK